MSRLARILLPLAVLPAGACLSDSGGGGQPGADAGWEEDGGEPDAGADAGLPGFDDHTVGGFSSVEALLEALVEAPGRGQVKFVLPFFQSDQARMTRFLDGTVYSMHDEWYWLRLLNGVAVPGVDDRPVRGPDLPTPEDARGWAREQDELPLDLRWVGDGRLYSPRFYSLVFGEDRPIGVGGLLHLRSRPGGPELPAGWLFELEYSDGLSHATLVRFFRSLEAVLPPEVAAELHWVTRSNPQHELADRMRAGRLAYWDRTLRYSELAVRGEVEVYNPGLAAGVLRVVRSGDGGLERARPADALVLEDVPDWLPPGAALITAVPQTPLAHVNLLARNRGIPNAYLGGVLDDPWLDQLSRGYSPLLVHAMAPDRLDLVALTRSQYSRYQELTAPRRLIVPPVDPEGAPLLVPLEEHELSEMAALRPLLGGKSAGFLALAHVLDDPRAAVAMPDRPIAVTVRAFVEHLVPLAEPVAAMLASDDFRRDARTRALVLEGEEGLARRFPGADAAELAARFSEERPAGDPLGDLARAGGLVTVIREQPLPPEVLATVTDALAARFCDYAPTQGLRFRSSANVEDIEGFSGAGLYESSTGFLDAAAQPRARDRKRTVAWALKRTFSSYWSVEAYEERALSGVDHAGGAMGVLVHARFDDPLEAANGVFLLTLLPPGSPERAVLELNVQDGDLSVTNPPPGSSALPEVDRVAQGEPGSPIRVTRVRPSTEVPEGEVLLGDAALEALFRPARRVGEAWLAAANAGVAPAQASRTVVLDFELRVMAPQWPALAEGEPFPPRLVVKQVRSVDPDLAGVPEPVRAAPFPRDVLARARRVDRRVCRNGTFLLDAWEAWTDPARPPDLGHDREPFLAWLRITFGRPPEGLEVPAEVTLDHTELTEAAHPGLAETGAWALALTLAPAAAARAGFDRLEVDADRRWRFVAGDRQASGGGLPCETAIVHATPQDYLRGLLEQALEEGSAH